MDAFVDPDPILSQHARDVWKATAEHIDQKILGSDPVIIVSLAWAKMTEDERKTDIQYVLDNITWCGVNIFELVDARSNGHVIFKQIGVLNIHDRGKCLMLTEGYLRGATGEPLEVYLQPTIDKNKFRRVLQKQLDWDKRRDEIKEA